MLAAPQLQSWLPPPDARRQPPAVFLPMSRAEMAQLHALLGKLKQAVAATPETPVMPSRRRRDRS